jgi:hypothetical protein
MEDYSGAGPVITEYAIRQRQHACSTCRDTLGEKTALTRKLR